MKRLIKWIFGAVVAVIFLLVVVIVAIPLMFDPNAHKARIESLVEAEIGRTLSIEGDISLSLFPWLGFQVGKVTLGNAPGFDDTGFASVQSMAIRVRLLPLLEKKVEMDTVSLDGLTLNLTRTAAGETNWDDLAAAGEKPAAGARAGPPPMAALAIGGVHLSNASIRFEDGQNRQRLALDNLKLLTGPVSPGRPVQVQTEFDFAGGPPQTAGRVSFTSLLALDPDANRYSAENFQISAALSGAAVPEGSASIEAKGHAIFDEKSKRLTVSGLDLRSDNPVIPGAKGNLGVKGDLIADLGSREISASRLAIRGDLAGMVPGGRADFELSGSVRANLDSTAVAAPDLVLRVESLAMQGLDGSLEARLGVVGNFNQRRFDFSGLSASGSFKGDALPVKGEVPLRFQAKKAALDLGRENASIDGFSLEVQGLKSTGTLSATALLGKPRFSGNVEVARFDLRALLTALGRPLPPTADVNTFTAASLSTGFKGDLSTVALEDFRARLDDTAVAGTLRTGFGPAFPVRFDLSLDAFDADRYLPPRAPKALATPASAAATAITLPVAHLRGLDVEGRLRAGNLKVSGVKLENVDVDLSAKRGKIQLNPLKTALYGGRYAGNVQLDVSGAKPALSLDERISGVRLDPLLKDLQIALGNLDFSGGTSDLRLRGDARGDTEQNRFQFTNLSLYASLGGKSFPGGKLAFDLQTDADLDLEKQTVAARAFQIKFGPMLAKGKLALSQFLGDPKYDATIDVPSFNTRALLAVLGQRLPETADPKALTAVAVNTRAVGSAAEVRLDPLELRLDSTRLQGTLALSNLGAPLPAARFDLKADRLDADRYLPPPAAKPKAGTPGAAVAAIPVETIRALDVDGRIHLGELKLANLQLRNVELVARGKDGRLQLSPLGAGLYQGTYAGNITVDASGKQPQISVNEKLTGIQAGPLLKDLQGKTPVTGRTDIFARLTASGADTNAIKSTLSGDAGFAVTDGTIKGIDLLNTLCRAFSGLSATSLRKEDVISGLLQFAAPKTTQPGTNQTEFAELKGTLNIAGGLARNEDLSMKSPLLRVDGKGDVNLATERVDYLATVALVTSCQGQGGRDFRELAGIPVPVRITGSMTSLNYDPQIGAGIMEALRRSQTRQAETQSAQPVPTQPQQPSQPQKPEDVLKDAGKKAVGDLLRGILSQ